MADPHSSRSFTSARPVALLLAAANPNQRFLWPNFRSPLLWDVFAALDLRCTVSSTFLMVGLVPDIAAVRDHSQRNWKQEALRHAVGSRARRRLAVASLQPKYISISPRSAPRWCALGALRRLLGLRHVDQYTRDRPARNDLRPRISLTPGAIYSGVGMVLTLIIPSPQDASHRAHDHRLRHFDQSRRKLTLP